MILLIKSKVSAIEVYYPTMVSGVLLAEIEKPVAPNVPVVSYGKIAVAAYLRTLIKIVLSET